jgi:hypothetical protein
MYGPDPPGGVRRQLHAALGIELPEGVQQTQVPFLDEVHQLVFAAAVLLGDLHHEAQIPPHQAGGGIGVTVIPVGQRQAMLLLGRQHRGRLQAAQVTLEHIDRLATGSALVLVLVASRFLLGVPEAAALAAARSPGSWPGWQAGPRAECAARGWSP